MIDYKIANTKAIISISATILVILVIILVVILGRSYVDISASPSNSIIRINNAPVPLDGSGKAKIKVKPGKATLTVEADGYIGYSQEMILKRGKTFAYSVVLKKNPIAVVDEIGLTEKSKATFLSIAEEDNSIFYLSDNGTALYKAKFQVDQEKNISIIYNRKISNPPLSGIKDIVWSPKKDAAIFKKDNGAYFFDLKKYNLVSQEEVKYGEYIGDIAWAPDDSKIAYYYAPPSGEKTLMYSNKINSEPTRVANFLEMGIENPYLKWSPDSEWLIVIPRNKDASTNKIYLFNTYKRTFTTVSDAGNNVEAIFSPDSSKIFYTSYSPDPSNPVKLTLSVMDKDGGNKKDLSVRALMPKVALLNKNDSDIIVATYNTEKQRDSLFIYNLAEKKDSGFRINLAAKMYVNSLCISNTDEILFYLADNKLYALSLK